MQSSGKNLFLLWRQNNKSREILLNSAFAGVQLQHTTFFLENPFLVARDPFRSTNRRHARVMLLFLGRAIQRLYKKTEKVISYVQLPPIPYRLSPMAWVK